jgi:hypothetical protein
MASLICPADAALLAATSFTESGGLPEETAA